MSFEDHSIANTPSQHRLLLVDGNAILHRAYHAFPPTLTTRSGELVNATYGFTSALLTAFKKLQPTHVIVCFDSKGPTFRHEQFEGYKKSRPKMDEELVSQIDRTKQVVTAFNIPQFAISGWEADDLIGTLAFQAGQTRDKRLETGDEKNDQLSSFRPELSSSPSGSTEPIRSEPHGRRLTEVLRVEDKPKVINNQINLKLKTQNSKQENSISLNTKYQIPNTESSNSQVSSAYNLKPKTYDLETVILTGDRDALQLIDESTKVFFPNRGKTPEKLVGEAEFVAEWGFKPTELIDFKALAGDASDEIPGVAGVGPKTATELIKAYGPIEQIYTHLSEIKETVRKKLELGKESAALSKQLATIKCDAPIALDLDHSRLTNYDKTTLFTLLEELEFQSLIRRLPADNWDFMVEETFSQSKEKEIEKIEPKGEQMSLF